MEAFLVLASLIVLAIPVSIGALLIGQSGLRKRLSAAEAKINQLQLALSDASRGPDPAATAATTPAYRPEITDETQEPAKEAAIQAPPLPETQPTVSAQLQPSVIVRSQQRRPSPVEKALSDFGPWLQENWFYSVSAASLALAGIFLVQYGMENGLLPPRARVVAALAFGAALIGAGEFIRRRFGDGVQSATAYLPSVFSGAGIVTLFGGILSARMLYDLIGGGAAMGGMVVVALLAMVLGWMHGPLLVAVGVIGAYAAPVVLKSSNSDASPLFGFFAIIAILGLGVDTIRRWGWISALTLVLAYFMGCVLALGGGGAVLTTAQIYFAVLAILAILIPARSFTPDHAGPPAILGILARLTMGAKSDSLPWPAFPTFLAFSGVAASCVILLVLWKPGEAEIWLSVFILSVLSVVLVGWSHRAPALQDAAVLPPLALLFSVFAQSENRRPTFTNFRSTYSENIEASFPWSITILVLIGAVISGAALWRAQRGGQFGVLWAAVAAIIAPAMALVLEMSWVPAEVVGPYPWALHAAGLAVFMVLCAERLARKDGPQRLRVSFAVMSALACMAFACVIVLSSVALTLALAVTIVSAAALDRVWNLKPLSWFIAAGVVTLGYRLVVDPGLGFGATGPLPGVLLAYLGTLAAVVASLWLLRPMDRETAKAMLDSAAWSTAGLSVSVLLLRWIETAIGATYFDAHWTFGLNAAIWLGLALAQVQRTQGRTGGVLDKLRWALAAVFAVIGGGTLFFALTIGNPLMVGGPGGRVFGPVLLNTLAAAYLMPAIVLLLGALRLGAIDKRLRIALVSMSGGLAVLWAFAVIRHFWQGGDAMPLADGISQPEQYTYTIVLLFAGAGLFYQSLVRRSAMIRKAGLVVIGLAVAKVFFIDVTDLDGLTRVFSLLVLGLALAGLAWLNRWAQTRDHSRAAIRSTNQE